jgi:hypothetical protein
VGEGAGQGSTQERSYGCRKALKRREIEVVENIDPRLKFSDLSMKRYRKG